MIFRFDNFNHSGQLNEHPICGQGPPRSQPMNVEDFTNSSWVQLDFKTLVRFFIDTLNYRFFLNRYLIGNVLASSSQNLNSVHLFTFSIIRIFKNNNF